MYYLVMLPVAAGPCHEAAGIEITTCRPWEDDGEIALGGPYATRAEAVRAKIEHLHQGHRDGQRWNGTDWEPATHCRLCQEERTV